jgi:tRNA-2-methylthio-N6-dimethylallyladenosine synthase
MVVFDKEHYQKGDYVAVEITECTSATLIGKPLYKTTTQEFFSKEAVTA